MKNSHLKLQCIYPFPSVSLVKNAKSMVSCYKSCLSIKSNWLVPIFFPKSFLGISTLGYTIAIDAYILCEFFLMYSFPIIYLFLYICKHNLRLVRIPANFLFQISDFGRSVNYRRMRAVRAEPFINDIRHITSVKPL